MPPPKHLPGSFPNSSAIMVAIGFHVLLALALIGLFAIDWNKTGNRAPFNEEKIATARWANQQEVEQRMKRLQELQEKRQREEQESQRLNEETQRRAEQQKKQQELARKEEQQRQALETQRRAEQQKKQQELAQKKITPAVKPEPPSIAEIENDLQAALLAEEQSRLSNYQRSVSTTRYRNAIAAKVSRYWQRSPATRDNFDCLVRVDQMPDGEVISAKVTRSCGSAALDRSVEAAVRKASPLPMPEDPDIFERAIEFRFRPDA